MKSRILIPLLLLLIVVVIGGYFAVSRVFHINQKARDYLVTKASDVFGGDFDASSVLILPWSISIRDAHIEFEDAPVELTVDRIRLKFSLIEFIRNRFEPIYGTEQVYLDHPEFVWISDTNDSSGRILHYEEMPIIPVKNIPIIKININKGSFAIVDNGDKVILANDISGWLDGSKNPEIILNVEGKILSKKTNTFLKGTLNRDRNSYSIELASGECAISKEKFSVLTDDMNIVPLGGAIDLTVLFDQKDGKLSLDGNFSLRHGFFELENYGIDVKNVFIDGTLSEKEIVLDTIFASVLDTTPKLTGRLKLVPELELKLNIEADNIELSSLLSEIYPEKDTRLSGIINFTATVEGKPGNFVTNAEFSSDSFSHGSRRFRDFGLNVHLGDEKLTVNKLHAVYDDYVLSASGRSAFIPGAEKNDFYTSINIRSRSDKKHRYLIQLSGTANPRKEKYSAHIKMKRPIPGISEFFNFAGNISLDHDELVFNIGNEYLNLKGTAENIFENAGFVSAVAFNHLPVLPFFGNDNDRLTIDGPGNLKGTYDSVRFDGDFKLNAFDRLNTNIRGSAQIENILKKSRHIEASAQLTGLVVHHSHPLDMSVDVVLDSSGVALDAVYEDSAVLAVSADLKSGALKGNLDIDKFPLESIIDIFKREEFGHTGRLTGRAEIGGSISEPFFNTPEPVDVTELKLGGLDRLTGTGKVFGKFGELTFSDLHINRDDIPIMDAYGTWVTDKPFILDTHGENIQFEAIGDILSKTRKSDGIADYRLSMVFFRKSGTIEGDFVLRNGLFFDIPIDEARGVLGGGSTGFNVTDFTIHKEGLYTGKGSAASGYFWKDETEEPGLKMNLVFQGDLLRTLPHLTGAIKKASGESQLNLRVGGAWQDPLILNGELYVTEGRIEPSFLVDKITDITANLKIEPDITTVSGYRGVRVRIANGKVNNKKLIVRNILAGDELWETVKRPELVSVVNNIAGLDFGILNLRIDDPGNRDRDRSIEFHIPGFMEGNETGQFELSGDADGKFFIGAAYSDGSLTPYISGTVLARSGDLTYPLLDVEGTGKENFTREIFWDINLYAGSSVYYVNEVNQEWRVLGTTVSRTFSKLEENSVFKVFGRLSDGSFRVTGNARSTSGTVSYFGADFDIERIELDLDSSRKGRPAILTGRAKTVELDSTGVQTEIYLNVSTVDGMSDQIKRAPGRIEPIYNNIDRRIFDVKGIGNIQIEFTSTDPSDDTQEKILAKLGISSDSFGSTAARAFTRGFDSYYTNKWLRPFEEALKKYTKLDVVRFTPSVLGNIMKSRLGFTERYAPDSDYMLFDETRIMVGESLFREWFLSYRGQYGLSRDFLSRRERGFFHEIGLQYNLKRNTRLHLKYSYDDVIKEGEKRIEIRHDFEF